MKVRDLIDYLETFREDEDLLFFARLAEPDDGERMIMLSSDDIIVSGPEEEAEIGRTVLETPMISAQVHFGECSEAQLRRLARYFREVEARLDRYGY